MQKPLSRIIRKFPKLHLLDYIVISILIIIISMFLVLRITRKTVWIPVDIQIGSQDPLWNSSPQQWYASSLKQGDCSYNTFGEKIAEVQSIVNIDTGDKRAINVTVSLKSTYDSKTKLYSFDFQPLVVGGAFKTTFGTQDVSGVIVFVGDNKPYQEKIIETKLLYVYPWVADALYKGLQVKDTSGRVVAEIKDITVQNSRRYELHDMQDRTIVLSGEDPERKDVSLRLMIQTKKTNGIYYFAGKQIKVGSGLRLEFPSVSAQYMEISAIIQ
jgi:hypothetical protein